jgi:hypothetical protein
MDWLQGLRIPNKFGIPLIEKIKTEAVNKSKWKALLIARIHGLQK